MNAEVLTRRATIRADGYIGLSILLLLLLVFLLLYAPSRCCHPGPIHPTPGAAAQMRSKGTTTPIGVPTIAAQHRLGQAAAAGRAGPTALLSCRGAGGEAAVDDNWPPGSCWRRPTTANSSCFLLHILGFDLYRLLPGSVQLHHVKHTGNIITPIILVTLLVVIVVGVMATV